ncbi:MAG: hypothetical protein HY033_11045 [Ignavibacteriae bacterium]|nr:hypothetical protein [Ignavibacteriota bacterium]
MKKFTTAVFAFLIFTLTIAPCIVFGGTKTFSGPGNFSDATKWNSGTLPQAGDNLKINNGCTYDAATNLSYGSLNLGNPISGQLTFNSGTTLTVTGISAVVSGSSSISMTSGGTLVLSSTTGWPTGTGFTAGTGTVIIEGGITLPSDVSTYNNLTISASATTVTLGAATTINGDLTITIGTLSVGASNFALNVQGNWTNNGGTFSAGSGTVTFNKNGNQTISGSSTSAFNLITVNMGTSKANTLDVTGVITMALSAGSSTLTLTNGTFKLSSASTITPFGGSTYTIPSTAGYFVNNASATSNWGSTASMIVNGDLKVAAGTMSVSTSGAASRLEIGATGSLTVSGGTLTINGRLQANASGNSVTISAGTVAIASGGTVGTSSNSIFEIANSTFSMTNGTVSVASPNTNTTLPDVNINTSGTPITGGTFLITTGSSTKTITVRSNVPFFNFQVQNGTAAVVAQLRTNTLQVSNNLTITSGTLDAATNNIDISVGGNWSNSGTYSTGTNTVTFNGSGAQSITKSGGETFNNLTMSKSAGTLTLVNGVTVNATLTLTSGTLADGGNTVTAKANVSNAATHTGAGKIALTGGSASHTLSGTGSYTNMELNDANGASLSASPTINGTLTFTLGKITLGANDLLLGTSASIATPSSTKYVVTDGAGALRQRVNNNATNVLYPIGLASEYLPVTVQLTAGSTADDIKARVADGQSTSYDASDNANGSAITNKVVTKTWSLKESVAGGSNATVTVQWNTADEGTNFNRSLCDVAHFTGGSWVYSVGSAAAGSNPYTQTISGITSFSPFAVDGQNITCSVSGSPFCAGNAVSVDYTASG